MRTIVLEIDQAFPMITQSDDILERSELRKLAYVSNI